MSYPTLFTLALTGLALSAFCVGLDSRTRRKAEQLHADAKARRQIANGYAHAEQMARSRSLTSEQRAVVMQYVKVLERAHYSIGLPYTDRFPRLRQTLTRNSGGLRAVL